VIDTRVVNQSSIVCVCVVVRVCVKSDRSVGCSTLDIANGCFGAENVQCLIENFSTELWFIENSESECNIANVRTLQ
jgi:hypothetical protein